MHCKNRQKTYENKDVSYIETLFKVLSRLGNVIIIAFGVVLFGIKRIVLLNKTNQESQTLYGFVKKLEEQLSDSTIFYDDLKKKRSAVKEKTKEKPEKQKPKDDETSAKKAAEFTAAKNKYTPKPSLLTHVLRTFSALVIIGALAFAALILFKKILPNKKISEQTGIQAETHEAETSKEASGYYAFMGNIPVNNNAGYSVKETGAPYLSAEEFEENRGFSGRGGTSIKAGNISEPENTPVPSPVIDIENAQFSRDILIHKGDKLDEVAPIQERLMDLHYMDADEPTTYYGEMTWYAMQLFQRGHDLQVDGVAGFETLTLLFSDEATPYMVREGDHGTDIEKIKERLAELGYLDEDNDNKHFDEDTDYAIRVFQGRNSLSQDGIVGYMTTQVLFDSSANAAARHTPRSPEDTGGGAGDTNGGGTDASDISYNANDAASLVSYAKSIMDKGYTYRLGGKAPPAMDCSGFVYYCLNQTGNKIKYKTSGSWAKSSYKTISSIHDVKAGDILCFEGHVAICIGNGKMIDSSSSQNCIRITNFESSDYWNKKWVHGKRVFE